MSNESIDEIRRLLHEVTAHLQNDTRNDRRRAVGKLRELASVANTLALTIETKLYR